MQEPLKQRQIHTTDNELSRRSFLTEMTGGLLTLPIMINRLTTLFSLITCVVANQACSNLGNHIDSNGLNVDEESLKNVFEEILSSEIKKYKSVFSESFQRQQTKYKITIQNINLEEGYKRYLCVQGVSLKPKDNFLVLNTVMQKIPDKYGLPFLKVGLRLSGAEFVEPETQGFWGGSYS